MKQSLVAVFSVLLVVAVGCASAPKQKTKTTEILPPPSPKEEEELERRVDALAHFAAGVSQELNANPREATDQYLQAAKADLQNEDLVLDVARRLIREQKNTEAVDLLERASAQTDAPASVYAWLGLAYVQAGETNLAIQANQKSIKHDPDNLAGYQNLAALQMQAGRTNEAVAVLKQATGRTNASTEFFIGTADLLMRFQRQRLFTEAETKEKILGLLDAGAAKESDNPLIMQRIADLYLLHGEPNKAEPIYASLLKRYPDIPGLRERLANLYIRTDKNEEAAKLLEEIKKENPTDPSTYFFLGSLAYESKDYDKAAESFETALKLNPEFEPLYYDLAGVHIARQQPAEALALLDKARGKFKINFLLEFYTGIAMAMSERWSDALSHMTSAELVAKTAEPNRLTHTFYYQLGSTYERSGNVPEAVKALRKCLELSPDYPEALNYLGYMWAERGENLEEAHSMLQRAVQREPDNAAFLDSLAWVLFKMQRPAEALKPMEKAIQLSEKPDPTLFDHLGDIQAALKEIEKARDAYGKSLAAKPDDKVKAKLDGLLPR